MELKDVREEISLKEVAKDLYGLSRNDFDLACPFIQPTVIRQRVQGSVISGQPQEQITVQKSMCNNGCPLFKLDKKKNTVTLSCGSGVSYEISKVVEFKQPTDNNNGNATGGDGKIFTMGTMGKA